MVEHQVPEQRPLPIRGNRRRVLVRLGKGFLRLTRKGWCAYILIAFVISLGFHMEERRTDRKIDSAVISICEDGNHRLAVLTDAQGNLQFKSERDHVAFLVALSALQPAKCRASDK